MEHKNICSAKVYGGEGDFRQSNENLGRILIGALVIFGLLVFATNTIAAEDVVYICPQGSYWNPWANGCLIGSSPSDTKTYPLFNQHCPPNYAKIRAVFNCGRSGTVSWCISNWVCRWIGTPIKCSGNVRMNIIPNVNNYATEEGCGANALANVLSYYGISPNTPSGIRAKYSDYFFKCGPGWCISDLNMVNILNTKRNRSSQLSWSLSWREPCPEGTYWNPWANGCLIGSSPSNTVTYFNRPCPLNYTNIRATYFCERRGTTSSCVMNNVCKWPGSSLLPEGDIYKEIDAKRPVILLIGRYSGKIYTTNINNRCVFQEWVNNSQCANPITSSDISGHYVTVVGYTNDKKYLVIRPGYSHRTRPCAPENGLVLISVEGLTDYSVITFRR